MKQEIVGIYEIGLDQIQLVIREGTGGEFYFVPEKGALGRIKVGADNSWHQVVSALMHEAFEMQMTRSHCRFDPAPDYGRDHSSYLFVMNHPMFSDITARVAAFMADSMPDLSRACSKWRKTNPRKR